MSALTEWEARVEVNIATLIRAHLLQNPPPSPSTLNDRLLRISEQLHQLGSAGVG